MVLMISLYVTLAGLAQTPASVEDTPRFEVASIKPNRSDGGINGADFVIKGRYTVINYPLWLLIGDAFGLRGRDQVVGGPDWINAAKYDISAITEVLTPTRAQYRTMLRHLLEERFSLRAHQETREVDVYDLVLSKEDLFWVRGFAHPRQTARHWQHPARDDVAGVHPGLDTQQPHSQSCSL